MGKRKWQDDKSGSKWEKDKQKQSKKEIPKEPWTYGRLKPKKGLNSGHEHYTLKEKDLKLSTPVRMVVAGPRYEILYCVRVHLL